MNIDIQDKFDHLDEILKSKEFNKFEYETVLRELYPYRNDEYFKIAMKRLRQNNDIIRTECTMQGRVFQKKYGYAGDFELIDKIYTEYKSDESTHTQWDEYFHTQPGAIAVRNRKKYFIAKMKDLYFDGFTVLNLASGPCRDMYELFQSDTNKNFVFDCIELDNKAIEFSKELLSRYKVNFINKSILRFKPEKNYDVIWSAGLFDYFDDKTFVRILKRFIDQSKNAKVIIGNFAYNSSTVPYMELIGEWYLNYRSPDKLIELAIAAGATKNRITIESEPEQMNLFLNIN